MLWLEKWLYFDLAQGMDGCVAKPGKLACVACITLALSATLLIEPAGAFELITKEEAALPPDTTYMRGITRGPKITLVWPAPEAGSLKSPLHLQLRFQGRGDNKVDPNSVLMTYEKIPPVDLTERIRPFVHSDGIEIDDAVVPPGHHRIQLEVRDTAGRIGLLDFAFDIRD